MTDEEYIEGYKAWEAENDLRENAPIITKYLNEILSVDN